LSVAAVAAAADIGTATLKRYETADTVPNSKKNNLLKLKLFFEQAGIEFIGTPDDGPGIRIRPPKSGAVP
jgi:hypothetical protein